MSGRGGSEFRAGKVGGDEGYVVHRNHEGGFLGKSRRK